MLGPNFLHTETEQVAYFQDETEQVTYFQDEAEQVAYFQDKCLIPAGDMRQIDGLSISLHLLDIHVDIKHTSGRNSHLLLTANPS
jgi:hypothetical protein